MEGQSRTCPIPSQRRPRCLVDHGHVRKVDWKAVGSCCAKRRRCISAPGRFSATVSNHLARCRPSRTVADATTLRIDMIASIPRSHRCWRTARTPTRLNLSASMPSAGSVVVCDGRCPDLRRLHEARGEAVLATTSVSAHSKHVGLRAGEMQRATARKRKHARRPDFLSRPCPAAVQGLITATTASSAPISRSQLIVRQSEPPAYLPSHPHSQHDRHQSLELAALPPQCLRTRALGIPPAAHRATDRRGHGCLQRPRRRDEATLVDLIPIASRPRRRRCDGEGGRTAAVAFLRSLHAVPRERATDCSHHAVLTHQPLISARLLRLGPSPRGLSTPC